LPDAEFYFSRGRQQKKVRRAHTVNRRTKANRYAAANFADCHPGAASLNQAQHRPIIPMVVQSSADSNTRGSVLMLALVIQLESHDVADFLGSVPSTASIKDFSGRDR